MLKGKFYINGQWVEGETHFETSSPDSGVTFASIPLGNESEIDLAVQSAKAALQNWKTLSVSERASYLQKFIDSVVERYGEEGEPTKLKNLIKAEMGKRLPEADIEVIETADIVGFYIEMAKKTLKRKDLSYDSELWPSKKGYIEFEPYGVVGIIKAWNYPFELPMWSIAPALLGGNCVVFKPSELSSMVGLEIAKIFDEINLPPGVFNLITGDKTTGANLVSHPDVDLISFTGSQSSGRVIAMESAKLLRKCILELGGNDPAIILKDADLELTSNGLLFGRFCNAGQVCVASKRVYVVKEIAEDLITKLVDKTRSLRLGTDIAPVVSEYQMDRIGQDVKDALSKGATILIGGEKVMHEGVNYYPPTILTNVDVSMDIIKHETFGPVMPIIVVENIEEAISRANSSDFGLGASIWSRNTEKSLELAKQLEAGMVWVNDVISHIHKVLGVELRVVEAGLIYLNTLFWNMFIRNILITKPQQK